MPTTLNVLTPTVFSADDDDDDDDDGGDDDGDADDGYEAGGGALRRLALDFVAFNCVRGA